MRHWAASASAVVLAASIGLPALLTGRQAQKDCPALDTRLTWYADNRHRVQDFIDANGICRRPGRHPLAVFDWDNTLVKNDVGDATTFWLLRNNKIRRPVGGDWRTTSRYFTAAAATALSTACPESAANGEVLTTAAHTRCADEILSVYRSGRTTGKAEAFAGFNHRRMDPRLAWGAQLLAGYTPQQVTAFARAARQENLAAPAGSRQSVGTQSVTGWVRYYDQMRDLVRTLERAGFDVRVVSASPEPVVRVWAQALGLRQEKVIGVRNAIHAGKLTSHLSGCGGSGTDTVITYIEGKRCFINRDILGLPDTEGFQPAPADRRQVLAAGDSDTDVTFVGDATGLRLAINRNQAELMCHAYANGDGKWLVNPMFIEPMPARSAPYPCSTTAYTAADGTSGPVRDQHGAAIPDQADTVH